MQISSLGALHPYYFNMNNLNAGSLDKISGISDDLNSRKTDFSGLTTSADDAVNENPLMKGQSANFMDILNSQMQMSRTNQSRIMTAPETVPTDVISTTNIQSKAVSSEVPTGQSPEALYRERIPNDAMMQMLFGTN